jgi:YidC/Oxa1 family membrane protein insertase
MMPLTQLPIFISFYFGMQQMGDFFPGMSTGGVAWFPDLTIADSTYCLPMMNSVLFFAMGEIGSAEMKAEHQNIFKVVSYMSL